MTCKGTLKSVVTYNSMLDGLYGAKRIEDAKKFMKR